MEATASSIHFSPSNFHHTFLPSSLLSPPTHLKPSVSPLHLSISISAPLVPLKCLICPSSAPYGKHSFQLRCLAEEVAVLENPNETQDLNQKRKLYVVNLPWAYSVEDLKKAFSECGNVKDVELIKNKDGKNRGYAFVTMASGEAAQAVIDKFDSKELSGRTIRVEYAKRLRKPRPQSTVPAPVITETRHKLYVSNLQWKVRSSHLREFFSAEFNPVSARVVFESASARSAGYGFVSFGTREEAEAAISALDGKDLMGRPVRLKFSERNVEGNEGGEEEEEKAEVDESVTGTGEEEVTAAEPENSNS